MKNKIIIANFILVTFVLSGCIDKKYIVKEWAIEEYKITLHSGQGLVGPRYYYYRLYKKNALLGLAFKSRKMVVDFEDLSSCTVNFNQETETKFIFDICTNKPRPKKEPLNESIIKSIEVTYIDSSSVRKVVLTDQQKSTFIKSWNRQQKFSSGSPRIKYLIRVDQGGIRTFNSDGQYLYEQEEDAKYRFSDTTFFSSLFGK